MSLVNFTSNDLLILENQRLDRLRSFFCDTLPFCCLHLDPKNTLAIHCSEPWLVDQLLKEIEQLSAYTWITVGAYRLTIYFAEEEIHAVKTRKSVKRSQHRSKTRSIS